MARQLSIQRQLMLWLLLPLVAIIGISLLTNYYLALQFSNQTFDEELMENAYTLVGQIRYDDGHWQLTESDLVTHIKRLRDQDQLYSLISSADGRWMDGDKRLGFPPKEARYPAYRNSYIDGKPVRILTLYFAEPNRPAFFVQNAETFLERNKLVEQIFLNSILHLLLFSVLILCSVWYGISKGLLPLKQLQRDVANRNPGDLIRLKSSNRPLELLPLVTTLNTLMERVEMHLSQQQRFIANAAHQLKTPLAGMQVQLELALLQAPETQIHSLSQIQISLNRSSHLIRQLLTLSRVVKDVTDSLPLESLSLSHLLESVVDNFKLIAEAKEITLKKDDIAPNIWMFGDSSAITEMLSNLLDNALRYSPQGGQVLVSLSPLQLPGKVALTITDSGPGISEEQRELVFERFYRGPDSQMIEGSGLGLSIVREIAEAHNIQIEMDSGHCSSGLSVRLLIPAEAIL